ncbi:hypothetical protein QUA00_19200 [Microcoleus sp. T2B6]|uniref:hypothetical protein n=1 Tax=Microcoleus sp. T2B6 TaxID=3055424 RepID=UPI002FD07649
MPVPQRVDFLVEQAEKPVPKKLIDNGATFQLEPTFHTLGVSHSIITQNALSLQ